MNRPIQIAHTVFLLLIPFRIGAEETSPLIPRDGGEVVERSAGVKGWTDRDYLLTTWPKWLDQHRTLHRSPMKRTRFEVFRPGYIVVLTPEKKEFNRSGKLTFFQGFKRVDKEPFHP